ncbi:hypothetical protein [Brachybacterium kimchii]|uniref:ATP/GTP-binding protein n=1 Tax=Brachybacterium kimchii TaxID=2942909 RepID=A0ABY4NB31_9MICO|nr:hypothetical protein [Brachybacterium kimchii]UQN31769.1 hypothetical protein M4486_19460 [Brachybacterium kimchii]
MGAGARTSVGNYSSGSPGSAKSSTPEGIVNPNAWHSIGDSGYNIRAGNPFIQAINKAGTAAALATGNDKATGVGAANFLGNMLETGQDAAPQGQTAPQAQPPAADDPPADAQPEVDPAELAQQAVTKMHLKAPEIASTPNNPDTLGAVGLPVWFWVSNPGTTTTGPAEATAEAGDVEVTATAKFSGLTVRTGDGKTVECSGPGTEYPGTGIQESPDCGHVYEQMSDDQPDGLYTVDITAHWTVEWESNEGDTGTIPIDLDTSKQLRIGQYETVVTDVS